MERHDIENNANPNYDAGVENQHNNAANTQNNGRGRWNPRRVIDSRGCLPTLLVGLAAGVIVFGAYKLGESRGTNFATTGQVGESSGRVDLTSTPTRESTVQAVANPIASATKTPTVASGAITTRVVPTPPIGIRPYPTPDVSTGVDDIQLYAREFATFDGPFCVQGDVEINKLRVYDNDPKTGEIVCSTARAEVIAPYGADVTKNIGSEIRDDFVRHNVELMLQSGCDKTCNSVREWSFDGKTLRVVKKWTRQDFLGGQSPVTPTVPTPFSSKIEDIFLPANGEVKLNGLFCVQGDVVVNGKRLFDDNPTTGEYACSDGSASDVVVTAPFGADISTNIEPAAVEGIKKDHLAKMLLNGCEDGKGCNAVRVWSISKVGTSLVNIWTQTELSKLR